MRIGRSASSGVRTRVVVVTADAAFEDGVRTTFGASTQIELDLIKGTLSDRDHIDVDGATVIVIDLDPGDESELQALERFMTRVGSWPPVVAVTRSFDGNVARRLMQMRVADLLVKPVPPVDLVADLRARCQAAGRCEWQRVTDLHFPARRRRRRRDHARGADRDASAQQRHARGKTATCLVDLDFQHGACADYLDIEPRLNLGEIEPRPERLDRQLLEVMLSHHSSGLAVVAAPNRPAEMRSFDPDVVTRLLDLVSSHFDYVVFDMPRTWFSWTDSVLLGSNRLFIVSETTVPGLRHAKQLVEAIRERLGDGPKPQVIINRFAQKLFSSGLRRSDIEQAIGDALLRLRAERLRAWCARPSIAACRSTRSSRATRSRLSSKS